MKNVLTAPKTSVFNIRVNNEIKNELEKIYAKNGISLTDAVNVFFQQSLNSGGFPFSVNKNNAEMIRAKAISKLMSELKKAKECNVKYSEEEAREMLGITNENNL